MIVVDASTFADMLISTDDRGRKARAILSTDPRWVAPAHWKMEVFSVIRGLTLGSKISETRAEHALHVLDQLTVDSVVIDALIPRMWQLRNAVGAYDAAYVVLAETRRLTLVTADAELARTATGYCRVELTA
jgi:predicted nucleic acid-binding protein